MKKVHKNRNRKFNQRLMESWGYSRNRTGGYKRDDERPLEAGLAEEEVAPDAAEKSKKQEIEGLAAEAIAAIHKLGSAAGATIDATVDTGGPAQMSDIAEMIEQEIRKMLLKEVDDAEDLLETDRRHPYSAEEGAVDPERLVNRGKTIAATWRQEHDPTPNPQEWQHRTVKYKEDPCDRIEKITAGMSDLEAQHKGLWLARAKCGISKRRRDKEKAQREKEFLARKKGDDNHPYPEISDETGSGFSTNVGKETFKESLREMIEQEIRKMLLKEEDDPVVVDIDKDGDMDLMISADFEQGSFETSGPSTDWALTTAQIGAMQETGKMEDALARGIDLKGVLMNATQGSHPDFLDVLELPAFQKDPRVKERGY